MYFINFLYISRDITFQVYMYMYILCFYWIVCNVLYPEYFDCIELDYSRKLILQIIHFDIINSFHIWTKNKYKNQFSFLNRII